MNFYFDIHKGLLVHGVFRDPPHVSRGASWQSKLQISSGRSPLIDMWASDTLLKNKPKGQLSCVLPPQNHKI